MLWEQGSLKVKPLGWIQHTEILEGSQDFHFKSPKAKKFAFTNVVIDIDGNAISQSIQADELVLNNVSVISNNAMPEGAVIISMPPAHASITGN
jgi:hypothetical protein